eukprot:ctg_1754.g521
MRPWPQRSAGDDRRLAHSSQLRARPDRRVLAPVTAAMPPTAPRTCRSRVRTLLSADGIPARGIGRVSVERNVDEMRGAVAGGADDVQVGRGMGRQFGVGMVV